MVKVAVYAIAKNEAAHVERWAFSARDADEIVLLDTGSDDGTPELAEALGVRVGVETFTPWRFDVARNASLGMVSDDVDLCIALDLDEVLCEGWREALEQVPARVTRPRYQYVWSWEADGKPGLTYFGDKIHARHGYRWRHPVHEVITPDGIEERQGLCGLEIHHYPDSSKSRGQYFPLLKLAVEEDPDDDRNAFYYARELYYHRHYKEAATEFKRHLALPRARWAPERARSMRYLAEILPAERESWLLRACGECPERREPWVDLAQHYYERKAWEGCLWAARRALAITERPLEYLSEPHAWGSRPHDLAALAAYWLGMRDAAIRHGEEALSFSPDDRRLRGNLAWYRGGA